MTRSSTFAAALAVLVFARADVGAAYAGKASAVSLLTAPAFRPAVVRTQGLETPLNDLASWTATGAARALLGERSAWLRLGAVPGPVLSRALSPMVAQMSPEQISRFKDAIARLTAPEASSAERRRAVDDFLRVAEPARAAAAERVAHSVAFDQGYGLMTREMRSSGTVEQMRRRIARAEARAATYEALSLYSDDIADDALAAKRDALRMRRLFLEAWGREEAAKLAPERPSALSVHPPLNVDLARYEPAKVESWNGATWWRTSGEIDGVPVAVDAAVEPGGWAFRVKLPLQEIRRVTGAELSALKHAMLKSSSEEFRRLARVAQPRPELAPASEISSDVPPALVKALSTAVQDWSGREQSPSLPSVVALDAASRGQDPREALRAIGFKPEDEGPLPRRWYLGSPDLTERGQRVYLGEDGSVTLVSYDSRLDQIHTVIMDADGVVRTNRLIVQAQAFGWRVGPPKRYGFDPGAQ